MCMRTINCLDDGKFEAVSITASIRGKPNTFNGLLNCSPLLSLQCDFRCMWGKGISRIQIRSLLTGVKEVGRL